MSARALAAPLHRHTREDINYVLEGRMGALLGMRCWSPVRGIWCSGPATSGTRSGTRAMSLPGFWGSSLRPALSDSSPNSSTSGASQQAPPQILANLCARYGLDLDPQSVPGLVERFGLRFPGEPM